MSAIQLTPENVDSRIAAVVCRFWWPVYAEFRDHGHTPGDSLRLVNGVIKSVCGTITDGLRQAGAASRVRYWVWRQTQAVLRDPSSVPQVDPTIPVTVEEAESREALRCMTRNSQLPYLTPFNHRWAHVLLEIALDRLAPESTDTVEALELDGLIEYLDQPLPGDPRNDFTGWIRKPVILSLKSQFWNELRQAVNRTITDPRILEAEILELFPPR